MESANIASSNVDDHQTASLDDNRFRSTLAQVLIGIARYLITVNTSVSSFYVAIVVPLLIQGNDGVKIDPAWSSYLIPTEYLFVGVGTLFIRFFGNWGRKPVIFTTLIIYEIAWIICLLANSIWALLASRVFVGIGAGLVTPINSFIGETCEPRLRGVLDTVSGAIFAVGYIILSIMGLTGSFRMIALLSSAIPIATAVYFYFIPESPLWLCSHQKYDEAMKSLIWLRGWKYNDNIRKEFDRMRAYCEENAENKANVLSDPLNNRKESCFHDEFGGDTNEAANNKDVEKLCDNQRLQSDTNSVWNNIKYIGSEEMLKPVLIMNMMLFFNNGTLNAVFPVYLPIILDMLSGQFDTHYGVMTIYGVTHIVSHLICSGMLRYFGKKMIILTSMIGSAVSLLIFGLYATYMDQITGDWSFCTILTISTFFAVVGPPSLMYSLGGELFPLRGRILGAGLSQIFGTFYGFTVTLIFLTWLQHTSFQSILFTYCLVYCMGYVFFKKFLIETEGKTLAEIQKEMNIQ